MARELTILKVALGERLTRTGRRRTPEPMVMDEEEGVAAFDSEDPVLQLPVYRFNAEALSRLLPAGGRVLDLGSGTGRLLADLARSRPDVHIVGTDLADTMLARGREMLRAEGLAERIELHEADMTALPDALVREVDVISCMWALHHLPDESLLRRALEQIAAVRSATGCAVWLFDFARMRSDRSMPALIALSSGASQRLVADGIASERAAWSASEIRAALDECGLGDLEGGSTRVLGHLQAYWAHGSADAHDRHWAPSPLSGPAKRVHRSLRATLPMP